MLDIEHHVNIWQVSPQISSGNTCQIWMRFNESNLKGTYVRLKMFLMERLTNGALVTPTTGHPGGHCTATIKVTHLEDKSLQVIRWSIIRGLHTFDSMHPVMTSRATWLNGPIARYVKFLVAHAPGMTGTSVFPAVRVSDADMYRGTCVTQWCMAGSLTSGFL